MAMILDGKKTAQKILDNLKQNISKYDKKPSLAVILANDSEASKIYVANKEKTAKETGFNFKMYQFDKSVTKEQLKNLILELNLDNSVHGIIVQLPLFNHLDGKEIIGLIDPKKDVDGFHPYNMGKLAQGNPSLICATPKGIMTLFKEYNILLQGKNVLVIGRSNIVGKPVSLLLINEGATVFCANSKTKNLKQIALNSDIIISATGHKNLVTKDMVKEGAIIIDVGISREGNRIRGDVDFENVKDIAGWITPVPKGVGPMNIASLMENTFEAFLTLEGLK